MAVSHDHTKQQNGGSNANAVKNTGNGIKMPAVPALQKVSPEEELQMKELPVQKQENKTGMPDDLKAGVESLSGYSMNDVKVHYNSSQPAQLQALAYAQGTDIHIAPGQEKHLPHEAWHVVQQKQGRVKPTLQMKQGIAVNDDPGLEHEADVMGAKALQLKANTSAPNNHAASPYKVSQAKSSSLSNENIVQRVVEDVRQPKTNVCWAAAGYAIHKNKGGPTMTLQNFVNTYGSQSARNAYRDNTVLDIDQIIGANSTTNRFSGSDPNDQNGYTLRTFTNRLPDYPIVACISSAKEGHYVVLESCERIGANLNITYMDPADGAHHTVASPISDANRVNSVGAEVIGVLYFT